MSKPNEDALVLPHDTCNVAIVCLPRQSFLLLPIYIITTCRSVEGLKQRLCSHVYVHFAFTSLSEYTSVTAVSTITVFEGVNNL